MNAPVKPGLEHSFISMLHPGLLEIRIIHICVYHRQDLADFVIYSPDGDGWQLPWGSLSQYPCGSWIAIQGRSYAAYITYQAGAVPGDKWNVGVANIYLGYPIGIHPVQNRFQLVAKLDGSSPLLTANNTF